jgi:hypothetical protein
LTQGKKKNSSILNVIILQMVRNECARFGGHVDIEVSYKILWLEIYNEAPILLNHLAFNKGCFEAVLIKNTQRTLGVNPTPESAVSPASKQPLLKARQIVQN